MIKLLSKFNRNINQSFKVTDQINHQGKIQLQMNKNIKHQLRTIQKKEILYRKNH